MRRPGGFLSRSGLWITTWDIGNAKLTSIKEPLSVVVDFYGPDVFICFQEVSFWPSDLDVAVEGWEWIHRDESYVSFFWPNVFAHQIATQAIVRPRVMGIGLGDCAVIRVYFPASGEQHTLAEYRHARDAAREIYHELCRAARFSPVTSMGTGTSSDQCIFVIVVAFST